MLTRLRQQLNYTSVVATIALFVALGGSSYAALSVTGKNIRNNTVTSADLRNGTVTSRDVKDLSLRARDFAPGQLPRGPVGPRGSDAQFNGAAAGGDLAGSYPAPTVAPGAVTSDKVADGSLRKEDIGVSSTAIKEDLVSVPAHICIAFPVTVPESLPSDHVLVAAESSDPAYELGFLVSGTAGNDTVTIKVCNPRPVAVDPGPATFRILVIR